MNPDTLPSPENGPPAAALDEDLLRALTAAQRPAAVDPERATRLRSRMLQRIAAASTPAHIALPAEAGTWRPFLPGIERKVLHVHGEVMSYLLRYQPGAVLPAHHHPLDEECIVLEGDLCIGPDLVLGPGGFHLALAGQPHESSTSRHGNVIYLRGAKPRPEHVL